MYFLHLLGINDIPKFQSFNYLCNVHDIYKIHIKWIA